MLEHCNSVTERWGGVSKILEAWLSQRQQLIVEFCSVSGVHDLDSNTEKNPVKDLQTFCELMVDYVSAGHFEIYDHLIQEAEEFEDNAALDTAKALYPKISDTTEKVLGFNDSVDRMLSNEKLSPSLARELSVIGETLVSRFEYEDQLIDKLHFSHKDLVATV